MKEDRDFWDAIPSCEYERHDKIAPRIVIWLTEGWCEVRWLKGIIFINRMLDTGVFLDALNTLDSICKLINAYLKGICEPVKTTGLFKFSSIKLNAVAAYAIVSVPIRTTKPSKCQ